MHFLRWLCSRLQWLLWTKWFKTRDIHDPTMNMALDLANEIGPPPALPPSLESITARVCLMEVIEKRVIPKIDYSSHESWQSSLGRAADILAQNPSSIIGVSNPKDRANIILRLWAGCMSAAKTIALQTRAGPNSIKSRAKLAPFLNTISANDPICAAGIAAAPLFKANRKEFYSLKGLPSGSLVATNRVQKWEL